MQEIETRSVADERAFTPVALRATAGDPFHSILNSISDGVFICDATTGAFLDVNKPGCAMFGYAPGELIGANIALLSTGAIPYTNADAIGRFEKACSGETQLFEWHCQTKDGRMLWTDILLRCVELDDVLFGLAIVRDITQRKQSGLRIQHERDIAQSYLDVAGVMIAALNPDGTIALLNRRGCEILGYENSSQIIGKSWVECFIPQRLKATMADTFQSLVAGGRPTVEYFENPVVTRTGEEKLMSWHTTTVLDERGRVVATLSSGQDITQERAAEEHLQQKIRKQTALAEFSLKSIASENLSGILTRAADQIIETLNTDHCAVFEASTTRNTFRLISQAGWASETACLYKLSEIADSSLANLLLRTSTGVRFSDIDGELRFDIHPGFKQLGVKSGLCVIAKDGGEVDILLYIFSTRRREFTDGEEEFAQTFGNMIRVLMERERVQIHLREREEQLRQAQKMEALGQLTGGVAHDFNNILTVILGTAGLLVDKLGENAPLRNLADIIENAAVRGGALTSQLLAYARQRALTPKIVNANRLIGDMAKLLRHTLSEDIEVEFVLGTDLWETLIDPSLLDGALMNLAINGRDAMPGGGRLTIETANVWIDQDYADLNAGIIPGPYVMIAVSDAGIGIPPENIARVFDPFFTTKEIGQGTGLGLSMVYGFVKQSKGHIKIYSEVGHGTVVKMYLPQTDKHSEALENPPLSIAEMRGTEKVLVVEDDAFVRAHAVKQLVSLGYEVFAVENGPKAIEALRQSADFDLMFIDIIMPGGMNGRQLAEAAAALRPSLKMLYTSGYTENAIIHDDRLDHGIHLLNKPYRLRDLASKVRLVLSEHA